MTDTIGCAIRVHRSWGQGSWSPPGATDVSPSNNKLARWPAHQLPRARAPAGTQTGGAVVATTKDTKITKRVLRGVPVDPGEWHRGARQGQSALVMQEWPFYNGRMDISVTEFKHRCLEIVRRVERTGESVEITRHGKVVAQLESAGPARTGRQRPWDQLRALGGALRGGPGESVLPDADFEAAR